MSERKILTNFLYPPIPIRQFDWVAYMDGDEEGPTGSGATEEAAILDLEEMLGLCPHCKREEEDGMGCFVAGRPLEKDM